MKIRGLGRTQRASGRSSSVRLNQFDVQVDSNRFKCWFRFQDYRDAGILRQVLRTVSPVAE